MSDSPTSFASRFARPGRPGQAPAEPAAPSPPAAPGEQPEPAPQPILVDGKPVYQPYDVQKVKRKIAGGRFRIYYGASGLGGETVGVMNYSYLTEMFASSDKFISMIFTNCVITLEGANLGPILDELENERLLWVRQYDAKKFSPPAAGEPVVLSIYRETLAEFAKAEQDAKSAVTGEKKNQLRA